MTPREVVARKLLDGFPGAAHWDDQWPGVRNSKLIDADAILTALREAGFAVVPVEVQRQIDRLPAGAPTNNIEALAWIAAAMEAKRAMLAADECTTAIRALLDSEKENRNG